MVETNEFPPPPPAEAIMEALRLLPLCQFRDRRIQWLPDFAGQPVSLLVIPRKQICSDQVLQTPLRGWMIAIVMARLSGFSGVYTEAIIKKRLSRNINVQNFWLYVFVMAFNATAILVQDFDAVMNKGFFHGYTLITVLMILNHALSRIAVSMIMKYAAP